MKIKNLFINLKSKIGFMYDKNKKLFIFSLVLIVLIVSCIFIYPKENENKDNNLESQMSSSKISDDYSLQVEIKIKNMLLSIDEIKKASVMVVCDSSEKNEYLKNITQTNSGSGDSSSKTITEEVVYEKNGSNSTPILVNKIMPKILGVWVVINEVSPSTKLAITNSISSVLKVDESCISILQER